MAFAELPNGVVFEIMQPIIGRSLMQDFLDPGRIEGVSIGREWALPGIQHVAVGMHDLPMAERQIMMKAHIFNPAMQGVWIGTKSTCRFCFFDTLERGCETAFEAIGFRQHWEDPEEKGGFCGWYPHTP